MKAFIRTVFCLTVTIAFAILIFLIAAKLSQIVNDKGTKLSNNDPIVTLLENEINKNDELRFGFVTLDNLSNDNLIHYALYSLEKGDYVDKDVKIKDGLCTIDNVMFNALSKCMVRVISTDTLESKVKSLFGKIPNIQYNEMEYKDYYCKYDSDNYYCLINNDYVDKNVSYAVINEAYEKKDSIYIYEYFLNINLANEKDCNKYFDEDYCNNYDNLDKKKLDNKVIIDNGALYKHTFTKIEDKYYLEESSIVNK